MKKELLFTALSMSLLLFAFTSVEKVKYSVDVDQSIVKWTGYHLVKSYEHNGNVKIKSGNFEVENDEIIGGEVIIDMTTISNNDLTGTDNEDLVGHLKAEDFFDVSKFPEAKLVITQIDGNIASGKITIKGITEKISFKLEDVKLSKGMISANTSLKIDRTKHKVMYGWTVENAMLSNEVQLDVKIQASR